MAGIRLDRKELHHRWSMSSTEPGHHGDGSFHQAVARGVRAHHWRFGDMPPVEGLSRRDVAGIVAYNHDITVVLDDWRLERNFELHESFGNRHDFSHAGRVGNVDRALFSRDTVRRSDRIRLRLINAATASMFPVSIGGGTGKVVAHDGIPLAVPAPLQDLPLALAQRTDVILGVTGPVTFALQTRQGPHDLGTIAVRGSNSTPSDAPIRPFPRPAYPSRTGMVRPV